MVTVLPGEEPGGGGTGPTATFTATPLVGAAPLTVTFNASASSYEGHAITYYSWNFGDGVTGTGMTTSHTYSPATTTTYHVVLRIIASDNTEGTATKDITVTTSTPTPGTNNPTASFTTAPNKVVAPKRIICDGGNSAAVAGRTLTEWIWRFGDGTSPSSLNTDAPIQHRYTTVTQAEETFTITLIVVDNKDGVDSEARSVVVENKQPVAGFQINETLGAADPGATGWKTADVEFQNVQSGSHTVWIRSEAPTSWVNTTPSPNDEDHEPNPKTGTPGNYSDHNLSYDPEGQGWTGANPAGFPSEAWGIKRFEIDWGDGTTPEIVNYTTGMKTSHAYQLTTGFGTVERTIQVTVMDYLGARTTFSRKITFREG
jgi:PKD repeat protein